MDPVHNENTRINNEIVNISNLLDSGILIISGGSLVLSFNFLIGYKGTPFISAWVLYLGWLFLLAAIILNIINLILAIDQRRAILNKNYDKNKSAWVLYSLYASVVSMVFGIVFLAIFGIVNFNHKNITSNVQIPIYLCEDGQDLFKNTLKNYYECK